MASTILEMRDITKTFPGVKALSNVNLSVEEGEIHAVVGENGAGKSTLMKVLSGVYPSGTYDVDDFVTGLIRTEGPTISLNGAWAQNIGVEEMFIDFLGDKAGIRLQYGQDFIVYGTKDGALSETKLKLKQEDMFQNEIDAFLRCVRTGEKLASHIDTVILSSQIIQAIYDSSEQRGEIALQAEGGRIEG